MPRSTKPSVLSSPKAIDVIAPGKAAPSPTSRPIIVTNRPMIKDPMAPVFPVAESAEPDAMHAVAGEPADTFRRVSVPLMVEPTAQKQPAVTVPSPQQPTAVTSPVVVRSEVPPAVTGTADSIADAADERQLSPDAPKAQADPLAQQRAHDKEAQAALDTQEKLILSKQYYLPIDASGRRRDTRMAILCLLFVVFASIVWLDLVLDAGIVRISGMQPLTHFFSVHP